MGGGHITNPCDAINRGQSHLAFEIDSKAAVDKVIKMAHSDSILLWEINESDSNSYGCVIMDPNTNCVGFSYSHENLA
jgi:hypothetical protein